MTVSVITIAAEGLIDFFRSLGKSSAKVGQKVAKNGLQNPARALDITANIATASATRNPQNVKSSLPEVITFFHGGKGLYLGKFV